MVCHAENLSVRDSRFALEEEMSGHITGSSYRYKLRGLDEELEPTDLKVFKFLCRDFLNPNELDRIDRPIYLFDALGK